MVEKRIKRLLVLDRKHTTKEKWRMSQYKMELDKIAQKLSLTKIEKQQVMYIIKNFGLKQLNKRASSEQIIMALAFMIKTKNSKQGIKLEWYKCVDDVKLTYDDYITVLINLINCYMNIIPLNGLRVGDGLNEFL